MLRIKRCYLMDCLLTWLKLSSTGPVTFKTSKEVKIVDPSEVANLGS
jgi:hypothetical protein